MIDENLNQQEISEQPVEETPVEETQVEDTSVEETPEQVTSERPTGESPESKLAPKVPENVSSKHFKRVLEEKEKIQRERDDLMRMLQEDRNRNNPKAPEPEEDYGIDVNNFVEGKDLKRVFQEVSQLKKELQSYKQKTQVEVTETRLRTEFPDFNKVFSKENVSLLEAENPELVETIATSSADPYKVAKSMYKAIKQFGVYSEDTYEADRDRVQKNLAKPKPVIAASSRQTGNSPLSKISEYADEMTEERKAALREEVRRYKR